MTDITPIIVDIETAPHPDAARYLEPVQAARNLKDPEKVKADIETRTKEREERLGLDWNVGRIVAIGTWTAQDEFMSVSCQDEEWEAAALSAFWEIAKSRTIIGFNCKSFDLPYLIQRSRLLGVRAPWLDLGKYTQKGVIDLFLELTFSQGTYDQGAMRRTLRAFATRFGVDVPDETSGKDVAAMVEAGDWAGIKAHCLADVEMTLGLARKLGHVRG